MDTDLNNSSKLEKRPHKITKDAKNSIHNTKRNQLVFLTNKSKLNKPSTIEPQEVIYKNEKKNMYPKIK